MIGILGGYGKVGLFATRFLRQNSNEKLRIGGRNLEKVPAEIRREFSDAEWVQTNAASAQSLESFFGGCDCILDAATLSAEISRQMDALAEKRKTPLVHLGISGFQKSDSKTAIVYGAGSIPGLSGLIPQYLAGQFDSVQKLDFYYGGIGTFSRTAAKDYLEGIFENANRSMVYVKDGRIAPYTPSENDFSKELKQFFAEYKVFPYFDEESQAIAQKLHLSEGRWQMCIGGERTLKVLDSARFHYKQNPEKTLEELLVANRLDTFGFKENVIFLCQMEGECQGNLQTKKLSLSGLSTEALTGKTAAAAALEVLSQKQLNGRFLLGESSLSNEIIGRLLQTEKALVCEIQENTEDLVEGEI